MNKCYELKVDVLYSVWNVDKS